MFPARNLGAFTVGALQLPESCLFACFLGFHPTAVLCLTKSDDGRSSSCSPGSPLDWVPVLVSVQLAVVSEQVAGRTQ